MLFQNLQARLFLWTKNPYKIISSSALPLSIENKSTNKLFIYAEKSLQWYWS